MCTTTRRNDPVVAPSTEPASELTKGIHICKTLLMVTFSDIFSRIIINNYQFPAQYKRLPGRNTPKPSLTRNFQIPISYAHAKCCMPSLSHSARTYSMKTVDNMRDRSNFHPLTPNLRFDLTSNLPQRIFKRPFGLTPRVLA